jgi:hypothetical protein
MAFNPKDNHIRSIMERLEKDNSAVINCNDSKQLLNYKQIREMRDKNEMFVGLDRRKNKSVIMITKPIKRKGKGFIL